MADPSEYLGLAAPTVSLDPADAPWPPEEWAASLPAPVELVEEKPAADPQIADMGDRGGLDWTEAEEAKARVEAQAAEMGQLPIDPYAELDAPPPLDAPPEQAAPEQFQVPQLQTVDELQQPPPPEYSLQDPDPSNRLLDPFEDAEQRQAEYERLDPEQLARVWQREDEARDAALDSRQEAILSADRLSKAENDQIRREADAKAAAESMQLKQDIQEHSERTIENDRWADSQSPLSRLGLVIGAGMGGFLKVMNGGRGGNTVLDAINSMIDQDIASQKADIVNGRAALGQRQSLLSQLRQTNADEYQAEEAARIVRLRQAAAAMALEAEKYDPAGTTARANMQMQQQALVDAANREAALQELVRKRGIEDGNHRIRQNEDKRAADKHVLAQAVTARKEGFVQDASGNWVKDPRRGTGVKKVERPSEATLLSAFKDGIGWDEQRSWYTLNPTGEGGQETKEQADRRKAIAEANATERAISGETLGVPGVVDGKGEQVLFQDKATAIEVAKGIGTTRFAVDVYDDLIMAIEEHGWSSDTLRSPEWQRAQVNAGELTVLSKEMGKHGALSGSDIELVHKQTGLQGDVTGVRNPTEGLLQARANLLKRQNHNIKALREEAQSIDIPRKKAPPAPVPMTSPERREVVAAPVAAHLDLATDIANRRQKATEELAGVKGPGSKYLVAANLRQDLRKAVEAGTIPDEVAWGTVGGNIMQEEAKVLAKRVMSEYKEAKKNKEPGAAAILKRAEDLKWLGGGGGTPREAWEILNAEDEF